MPASAAPCSTYTGTSASLTKIHSTPSRTNTSFRVATSDSVGIAYPISGLARRADQHQAAASERELHRLIGAALVLENLIESGDAGIRRAVLDVHRHVGVLDEDPLHAVTHEHELSRRHIGFRWNRVS